MVSKGEIMKTIFLLCFAILFVSVTSAEEPKADLVLRHAKIYTMDKARSWAESIAIQNGSIVYVGSDKGVAKWIGPNTRTMDMQGKFVMPSFIDSHVHPVSAGIGAGRCSLNEASSKEAVLKIVKQYAESNPDLPWIVGSGWQPFLFPDANPQKEWLDAIVPDRPVYLEDATGHFSWVNSKALHLANVTKQTRDPEGGRIERNAAGEPSGTLRESAADLVDKMVPPPSLAEGLAGLQRSLSMMNRFGITGYQDAGVSFEGTTLVDGGSLNLYRDADQKEILSARIALALYADPEKPIDQIQKIVELRKSHRGKRFQITAVKIFNDGVIEGGTAALLEPYLDKKDTGILIWSPEKLNPFVKELDRQKFQIHFHAIGDRAIRVALDSIEQAYQANGMRDGRPLLAHIQLFDPKDIPRFVQLKAIACFQPLWAYEDAYIRDLTIPRLGPERMRWNYPMRSIEQTGATLAFGSDWDVTSVNPLDAIEVAVTRQNFEGATATDKPFYPEERISLETALAAYTIGSAYANFWERETGSLETGKSADLIVLSSNLFEIPPQQINQTNVLWTIFEGKTVYKAID
jgi:predicted amidohydrolase YtcJ